MAQSKVVIDAEVPQSLLDKAIVLKVLGHERTLTYCGGKQGSLPRPYTM
ncbi:jg22339, partial [Pararge aegeria aegeria]